MVKPKPNVVQLRRKPNKADIKFGHGCDHYNFVMLSSVKLGAKFVTIDGVRWTVVDKIYIPQGGPDDSAKDYD